VIIYVRSQLIASVTLTAQEESRAGNRHSSEGYMYTDHQGTDDQCALMISVAPLVTPVSVHQCQMSVLINATCQCPSVPHQCHISVPTSSHQCHISVPI
ncbi:unnamed protein product, partial [Staurois parvus]